ncbi:hypothetical protein AAE02nite_27360 [Adhaeribacter aerolatus]|uniref:DUF4377 domain-containing protein n=1 Tax=Adhaeribacter aerolatus TaxID=670289 RepID=A0A512AZC5_9BACT|nr:hypothetical protein [Adhaeribacter aerolatus]GEO05072.1 hypothetical protein AAE02nite_27360 [Adhaeribacter aerolatus]
MMNKICCIKLFWLLAGSLLIFLPGCDTYEADVVPISFQQFELKRDSAFTYVRKQSTDWPLLINPLVNDSLKVHATVTYGEPRHGRVFQEGNYLYYEHELNYVGLDSMTYEVCTENICKTEKMIFVIENRLDPNNCTTRLTSFTVETLKNSPIDIRIHRKDIICPTAGNRSYFKPQLGNYSDYRYSGSPKATVMVYYPPKDFVGDDFLRYRIYTDNTNYLENMITIRVKATP